MDALLNAISGLFQLQWWGYVLYILIVTHTTIASVTIYLHRFLAHRTLELHPVVRHFFRFWLWLTTGMFPRVWASLHRKHHVRVETVDDPHSPQIFGLKKVLLEGAELYRIAGKDANVVRQYGKGLPNDWLERNLYGKHDRTGILLMLVANIVLFGPIGITLWALQMMWIPFFAAGVINGVGHYWGYRNTETKDASTNVFPLGVLIGGEELHNNHHAYTASAKLSLKWWEFDIGWCYIRILEMIHLAHVKFIHGKKVG